MDQFQGFENLASVGHSHCAESEFVQQTDGDLLIDGVVLGHQDVQQREVGAR